MKAEYGEKLRAIVAAIAANGPLCREQLQDMDLHNRATLDRLCKAGVLDAYEGDSPVVTRKHARFVTTIYCLGEVPLDQYGMHRTGLSPRAEYMREYQRKRREAAKLQEGRI